MQPDDFSQWIAPAQSRMINCTWRIVRTTADTEDVIQEVLLHAYKHFDAVRNHPNPTALLLRICTQKALDHLRRRKTHGGMPEVLPSSLAEPAPSPRQQLVSHELRDQLLDFIRKLPAREAEAITLFALEELGYSEVAAAMNCSEPTVRVLVHRARERFRAEFKNQLHTDRQPSGVPMSPELQKD
ncbi:MAG: sigma-70 family RNA polymerase sigma factor [Nibricoccus sp.]